MLQLNTISQGKAFKTMKESPYVLLGLLTDATAGAIKKASRKKARDHHPDKNPGTVAQREPPQCERF